MQSEKLDFNKILNRLILFIGLGVAAHIVFVLLTTERELLKHIGQLSLLHLFLIAVLMILPWLGYATRIVMWSGFLGEIITFVDALRVVVTADVASALSPTAVGGAPIKAGLLLNRGYKNGSVGFMLTWGMIEDILFYSLGILIAAWYSNELMTELWTTINKFVSSNQNILLVFIGIILSYFALFKLNLLSKYLKLKYYLPAKIKNSILNFRQKIKQGLEEMKASFSLAFRHGKTRILLSFIILILQWLSKFSILVVIVHAFGIDFETIQIYIRQWVVYVTMLFIPTPGASGGAEASFLLIFGNSIPKELSFLIVSLWRLFTYYVVLLTAVFLYSYLTILFKKKVVLKTEDK